MNSKDKISLHNSFFIETYGCQMNLYDSELVTSILIDAGYSKAESLDSADIVLLNTCAVREHAEKRVMGRITVLKQWKKQRNGRKIGVLGCVAQVSGNQILKQNPFVDFIAGPDTYRNLPQMISDINHTSSINILLNSGENYSGIEPIRAKGVTGWLAIMRGCNNFCTYCIVPYTRGRERSRPAHEIIDELKSMADKGIKDVTLLGQNVNSYSHGKTDFTSILYQASKVEGILRIRFLTSHPKDISDSLLHLMAENKKICSHLHLPLQAGSDKILKAMTRGYTLEHYLEIIEKARSLMPDLSLSTDIIVGFPGETQEDFKRTYNAMKEVRFDDAFTYRFSPRTGTAAAKMKNQIPEKIIMERLDSIIKLQRQISLERRKTFIGSYIDVIPETTSKHSEAEWIGNTEWNFPVVFPKGNYVAGELVTVKITELKGMTLRGVPISN